MKMSAGVAGALIVVATIGAASAQDLPGKYQVQGTNPDGSTYGGTAEIVATSENTCRITWQTGSTTSAGICMRNGPAFAAGYVLGDAIGLVVYEIKSNGTLEGLWTIADQKGVGEERLTPVD
jgi:hypothetical protein